MKKLKAGEGDWNCVKEVLGWEIDREFRMVSFLEQKLLEMNHLLATPTI